MEEQAISEQGKITRWYHEVSSVSRTGAFARAPEPAIVKPDRFKHYPDDFARIKLPAPRGVEGARSMDTATTAVVARAERRFDLADVSRLLHFSAGITGSKGQTPLRAAPSSGATFAVELYVVVNDVCELDPGVYHYNAETGSLVVLEKGKISPKDVGIFGASKWPGSLPLAVISSVVFARTQSRYSHRSFRYMMADVGHVLENLRLVALELGYACSIVPAFDQKIAEGRLELDPAVEGVIAITTLNAPNEPLALAPTKNVRPQSMRGEPFDDNPVLRMHALCGLKADDDSFESGSILSVQVTSDTNNHVKLGGDSQLPPSLGELSLGPSQVAAMDIWQVLQTRRSDRVFSAEPVSLEELSSLIGGMIGPGPSLSRDLQLWAIVNHVQGVEPGLYRIDVGAHKLRLVRRASLGAACAAAFLGQKMVERAAVVLIAAIDGNRVLQGGARRYRDAWIEAGMTCERVYLDAWARGLGGCAIGAYYDDETAEVLGFQGDLWPGEMMAVGHT